MYGYAAAPAEGEEPEAVKMKHLTGVLCIAVKGEASIAKIEVSSEKTGIAGNFEVNCETGELKALAETANSVVLDCGAGVALNANEAVPFYVALPAGEYGLFTITLTSTNNEVMVARFNSDNHPIVAGKVKEFKAITFVADAEASAGFEGDVVISTAAELCSFARYSEVVALDKVTSVTIGANIDLSTVATTWSPIQNLPAITFDGGNYEIKGLTAPLIATATGATIKNVKLTGVNITETSRLFSGSLACEAYNSTITNCSVAGAFNYAYAYELEANNGHTIQGAGGIIGLAKDTNVSSCTNYATVKGVQFWSKLASGKRFPTLGGVVGTITASSAPTSKEAAYCIKDCKNLGSVSSAHNASSLGGTLGVEMGGVAGRAYFVHVKNIINGEKDTEKGAISITANANSPYWGGCVGWLLSCYADGLTNYAPICFTSNLSWSCMGGVIGTMGTSSASWSIAENLYNYGKVYSTSKAVGGGMITLGGVIGRSQSTMWRVRNAYNYGEVIAEGDFSNVGSNVYVGGVFAECNVVEASDCHNYANVRMLATKAKSAIYVGGVAGIVPDKTTTMKIDKCSNTTPEGANAKNIVEVTTENTVAGNHIGGAFGYITSASNAGISVTNCKNEANVKLNAKVTTVSYAGGLIGYMKTATASMGTIENCENDGAVNVNITYPEGSSIGGQYAGIAGVFSNSKSFKNNHNRANGDITVNGTFGANLVIMGCTTGSPDTSDCSNAGDIDVYATQTGGTVYIAGLTWTEKKTHTNFTNTGNFTFHGKIENTEKFLFMSGCDYTGSTKLVNCKNQGTLKVASTATFKVKAIHIGGISRTLKNNCIFDGCENSGDIIFEGTTTAGPVYIGGLGGCTEAAYSITNGFTNTGNISFNGTSASNVRLGGVCGSNTQLTKLGGVVKNADNTISYNGKSNGTVAVGGIFGHNDKAISANDGETFSYVNSGTIDARNGEGAYKVAAYLGGVVGYATTLIENAQCVCDIKAIGFVESAEAPIVGVGIITGAHRGTSALVSKCKLSGRVAWTEENGQPVWTNYRDGGRFIEDLEEYEDPFLWSDKIYGGKTAWTSTDRDGCEYLKAIK